MSNNCLALVYETHLRLIDTETYLVRANLQLGSKGYIISLTFNSDNTLLATGLSHGIITVWRIDDIGSVVKESELNSDEKLISICFANTSQLIAAHVGRDRVVIWDHVSGDRVYTLEELKMVYWPDAKITFSRDDASIIMWSNGNLLVCDVHTGQIFRDVDKEGYLKRGGMECITVHPDKSEAVVAYKSENIGTLNIVSLLEQQGAMDTAPTIFNPYGKDKKVMAMCYNQEGSYLAVDVRSHVLVYELSSRRIIAVISLFAGVLHHHQFAFANNFLALRVPDAPVKQIAIYDILSPESPIAHFDTVRCFIYSNPCVVLM